MKNQKDPMGDRFKRYEQATQMLLPRRTYTIMRLDGRAFHTVLRSADKPFDTFVANAMNKTTEFLCHNVSGTVFAYTQSDEISLLLQDFESIATEPWFGGNVQKMVSVGAALATQGFAPHWEGPFATFDCRVFTLSDPVEVANYFVWRQRDCVRNSILAAGQAVFGHKQIQGLNTSQIQEKLWSEKQLNWNDSPPRFKRGSVALKETYTVQVCHPGAPQLDGPQERTRWTSWDASRFDCDPDGFLGRQIPALPRLS